MASKLVRKNDPAVEIIGTLEQVPGTAMVVGAEIDAEGRLQLDYDGTRMHWNGQVTQTDAGERIFIDENDDEVLESDVVLMVDDQLVEASWRSPILGARDAIEPMLVLSTAHVRPSTMEALSRGEPVAPHRVIAHDYGALLYVGEDAPCASDLAEVLAFARKCRCVWINLDRDAPPISGLATYAWEEGAAA